MQARRLREALHPTRKPQGTNTPFPRIAEIVIIDAETHPRQSHQNKFHADSLRNLTLRFASMREGDPVTAQDKELWEYFATLYKNSNKGIKGRGKDRRISAIAKADNGNGGHGVKQERSERSGSSDSSMVGGPPDVSDLEGPAVDIDSSASSYSNDEQDLTLADHKMF